MLESLPHKHISAARWAFMKVCSFDVIASDELRPGIVVDFVLNMICKALLCEC